MKKGLLIILLLLPILIYIFFSTGKHGMMRLPIYYPTDEVTTTLVSGKERKDTVYHTIPSFSFTNQDGRTVTEKDFEDKIYVADFFFTTCPTICPRMQVNMGMINAAYMKKPDVMLISHTVDPEHDTVEVLSRYAELVGARSEKWHLVTGDKKEIYDLAMDGYKLAVDEDPRAPGGFLHSEFFVLIDKQRRVRGYYDGTDSAAVNQLIKDIKILSAEYESKSTKGKIEQRR